MQGTLIWIIGGIMGILALLGLFIASHAHGGSGETLGLGLFMVCVLGVFYLINKGFKSK